MLRDIRAHLVAFPLIVILISMLGFLLGIPITRFHFIFAVIVSLVGIALFHPRENWSFTCMCFAGVLAASILIAAIPVMYTVTDGANCHRPATFLLAHGWNPIYESEPAQFSEVAQRFADIKMFGFKTAHIVWLPKGVWVYGAVLYKSFGFVEIADSLNVYLLICCFIIAYDWLRRFAGLSKRQCLILAAPICGCQYAISLLFGGCVDGGVYYAIAIGLFGLEAFRREKRVIDLTVATLAIPVAVSIKFTGLPIAIVASFAYLLFTWKSKTAWLGTGMILFLIVALNISPFVTSSINHGGPFYPAHSFSAAERSRDAMTGDFDMVNEDAGAMGFCGRFAYAYLSKGLTKSYYRWKLGKDEFNPQLMLFDDIDGLGLAYRVFFILSLIGLVLMKDNGCRLMVLVLLVSSLMQPAKYIGYGRYALQLYLLPIIAMVGVSMRFDNQYIKTGLAACASLYCAVLVAKALLPYPYMWIISTQNLQTVEAVMKDPKPVVATSYYYCLTSWRYDNRPDILFVGEREAPNTEFSYGPCTSKYRYLTDRKVDDFSDFACASIKDGNAILNKSFYAQRTAGIEKYFVKEFLPKELPRVPLRICQVLRLRYRQFVHCWLPGRCP